MQSKRPAMQPDLNDLSQVAPALAPDKWLHNYGDQLYNYALSRLRRHDLAEDVVGETLVAAVRGIAGFEGRATERTWLMSILKRKVIDCIRKQWHTRASVSLSDEANPEKLLFTTHGDWQHEALRACTQPLELSELWQVVVRCLNKLPQNLADVFVLRVLEQKNTVDICKDLEIDTSMFYRRLHRARLGVAKCVSENWGD
ncbi:MAG: sigma-70 family RNA polymerase sigma factor [Pirellulaceae bacterium]|nr:sigma-70 family RNA polymerase sigma factor [Pirellulaceae bacterium]